MALSPGLWIHLAALMIVIISASDLPIQCRGSVRKVEPVQLGNSLTQTYYRFYCVVTKKTTQQFDLFHEFTKKPFTRLDCKQSGCKYTAWNKILYNRLMIIDAEWGNSEQYAITVVQLRVCKVPADHNVNRVITITRSQWDNRFHCKGLATIYTLRTDPDRYRHWKGIEDHYVHLTSDMITTREDLMKVNSGHRLVIHTHLPFCQTYSRECHITLWMPYNLDCNFYDHITNETIIQYEQLTYSDQHRKLIIARRRKMIRYNMLYRERVTERLYVQPAFIQSRCRYPTDNPTSFLIDTARRVKVLTSYWPNITVGNTDGAAKRIGDNFYIQPDQQILKFYIMVVSTEELLFVKVNRTDKQAEEGEITINKLFRNSLNYTTMYTLTLSKFTSLTKNPYKIEAAARVHIPYSPYLEANSSLTISIIILTEIRMAVNPSYAAVVRGDKSSKPWFLCVAVGYPVPTIKWSGISSLYEADQVPANKSELPKGYVGTYLQFPSADKLNDLYTGEYICKASDPVLGTKRATAILMVFEPGSSYDIFKRYVSNKQEMEDEEEEEIIDLTDDEISLLRHLKSPFITEAHKTIKENAEVVTTSLLALVVGVIVLVSLIIWVIIKTCRRCKQLKGYRRLKKKKRPVARSKDD